MNNKDYIRKCTVRQVLVLNRACDKPISSKCIIDLYENGGNFLRGMKHQGLLKVAYKSEKASGGLRYYTATDLAKRVVIENEKLLEEMLYPKA